MRVAILRREPNASFSMNVHADGVVKGLKTVRPDWEIIELTPAQELHKTNNSLLKGFWKYHQRYWQFPQTAKKCEVDIFHIIDHSDGHLVYWLKSTGKPVVVTCHDLINFLQPENISSQAVIPSISTAAWKFAVKGICKADHIISVSSQTKNDVVQILNVKPESLTVVPNAVDSGFHQSPIQTEFRQQHSVTPEKLCLLNVGSNHPRKNVFTILEAIKLLKEQGLPFQFWKVGADFTAEQKQFIQTHSLDNFISYLGKPTESTLVEIYNAADVLISPSLYEGFGMTILEAMACGTPVITSNVTSLPEVAGDAAILVNPTDFSAIAEAVWHLYKELSYRQSLVERGLARVKLFSWEKTAEKVAQVYEQMLTK